MSDALLAMGAVPEAMQQLRRSLEVASAPEVHSNLLYAMNFVGTVPRKEVLQEHRAWGRAWGEAAPAMPHANAREPERRLRVGYLSADMRLHSVAYFLAPLLAAHDRAAVEVHGFPSVRRPDATTERLRGLCDGWTPVHALSDADAAAAIRDAGIDVLVELGGHTGQSRLRVLAHRPAPVQVSWLGYPNTTGLDAVGFRLTDAMVDPEGDADAHHVEKLWRLPSGFLCYEPPPAAPDVGPPPSAATGTITFGSFNTLAKTSPRTIELWARILRHVEGSRLVLKSGPLADAGVRQRVTQLFAQQGVDAARLVLDGRTGSLDAHLARYGEIDVALDPFPYNGTTTTCEALWMGVPVVALEGDRHVARVSASILRRLGLDGLVASTPKDYQAIATGLARDRARLAELRRGMRERMRGSPLGDGARFAREVEQAYRAMWRAWCA
jgi:predicted O-linked N-acetylglucosamine transferase (SPINDLY family)